MRVGAVVQRALQSLEAHHRTDEHRRQAEREQAMGNGLPARHLGLGALLVDVNPLLIAGCFGKLVDAVLRHFYPVAGADLSDPSHCRQDERWRTLTCLI